MKYRKKPVVIEAVQFTGQDIEGVRINRPEIIYSIDKKLFYISGTEPMARAWLSIAPHPTDGKHVSYPFMMYEIKSHPEREPATNNHPLVDLYLHIFQEKRELRTSAYIDTLEGTMEVKTNDWVIKGIKGEYYPCKPDIFEQTYELVE